MSNMYKLFLKSGKDKFLVFISLNRNNLNHFHLLLPKNKLYKTTVRMKRRCSNPADLFLSKGHLR